MTQPCHEVAPPSGYRYGGHYRPSRLIIARAIGYILLGWPRSLARDALLAVHDMPAPPLVRGEDRVPEEGPFIVVANHYERPGLWMAWPALLVSVAVRQRTGGDVYWIAIQEWETFSLWGVPIPRDAIRRVFSRAFATYGILAMAPPDASAAARAASVREASRSIKEGRVIGIMPEGTVGPTPELLEAREGAGSFLLLLAGSGAPLLPVGLFEEEGRLVAQFGEPFALIPPEELSREERDDWARDAVMQRVKALLPRPLWGAFAEKE